MNAECVADFVDGSISVSYDDETGVENAEINGGVSEEVAEVEETGE